jgi:hypothetical protein
MGDRNGIWRKPAKKLVFQRELLRAAMSLAEYVMMKETPDE